MAGSNSIIETGVDKLVKLVRQKGRISVSEAAKLINVGSSVVTEWAEFLEEEGIISMEYTLTQQFLVERKLTRQQIKEKAREFESKRDIFVSKAETSLTFLNEQIEYLGKVKEEFDDLNKKFRDGMSFVKNDLEELEKYEQLKTKVSEEQSQQKKEMQESMEKGSRRIDSEQKKLQGMLEEVQEEEREIDREKHEAATIDQKEKKMHSKLEEFRMLIDSIEKKMRQEDESVSISSGRLDKLKSMIASVKDEILKDKEYMESLIKESRKHEASINQMQGEIIKKIKSNKSNNESKIRNARVLSRNIKNVFSKKKEVTELFEAINKNSGELRRDLTGLIKKARSFEISSESKNLGKEILELEGKFEEVNKKKLVIEDMYKKIMRFIRPKK